MDGSERPWRSPSSPRATPLDEPREARFGMGLCHFPYAIAKVTPFPKSAAAMDVTIDDYGPDPSPSPARKGRPVPGGRRTRGHRSIREHTCAGRVLRVADSPPPQPADLARPGAPAHSRKCCRRGNIVELDADDYLSVLQRMSDLGLRSARTPKRGRLRRASRPLCRKRVGSGTPDVQWTRRSTDAARRSDRTRGPVARHRVSRSMTSACCGHSSVSVARSASSKSANSNAGAVVHPTRP